MNITTKFAIGSIVYAVHSCKLVCNSQIMLNEDMMYKNDAEMYMSQANANDVYIVSPHEVRVVTVSSSKGLGTEILYELTGGIICKEKEVFSSFNEASEYAAGLYEKSVKRYGASEDCDKTCILKELICSKLQHSLKAVLSCEQLERFEEEFMKATQGFVFREAKKNVLC